MAPRDPEAHRLFDRMASFYDVHPSASGRGLMAWNQSRDCRDAPDGGHMSATDGDLDTAWAPLLADQRWGDYSGASRSSDFMPASFAAFARADRERADRETGGGNG